MEVFVVTRSAWAGNDSDGTTHSTVAVCSTEEKAKERCRDLEQRERDRPTTWDNPFFEVEGPFELDVDTLAITR